MKIFSSLRKYGLLLVAVITTTGITPIPASAQELLSATPKPTIESMRLSSAEISNFGRVSSGIARGGQPSQKALVQMSKDGFKTVIDLRMNGSGTEDEEAMTRKLGMKYVHIPMTLLTPNAHQVSQFLDVVTKPENLPAFVHCRQGADRTGTLVAIYRRLVQGWGFDKAYDEMRQHHFKPFLLGMKDLVKNCDRFNFLQKNSAAPITITASELQPAGTVTMTTGE